MKTVIFPFPTILNTQIPSPESVFIIKGLYTGWKGLCTNFWQKAPSLKKPSDPFLMRVREKLSSSHHRTQKDSGTEWSNPRFWGERPYTGHLTCMRSMSLPPTDKADCALPLCITVPHWEPWEMKEREFVHRELKVSLEPRHICLKKIAQNCQRREAAFMPSTSEIPRDSQKWLVLEPWWSSRNPTGLFKKGVASIKLQ